jgi:hypothetical protein
MEVGLHQLQRAADKGLPIFFLPEPVYVGGHGDLRSVLATSAEAARRCFFRHLLRVMMRSQAWKSCSDRSGTRAARAP